MEKIRCTAVPLVTVDPYFSIWSFNDKLYDDAARHWTGRRNTLTGAVKVDGKWYRFLGKVSDGSYYLVEPEAVEQKDRTVTATKSEYLFENDLFKLCLTFRTPLLMNDLELMTRPISYISYDFEFKDGEAHDAEVYFDIGAETCTDSIDETVEFIKTDYSISCGRGEKNVLEKSGDDVQINWGYMHIIAPGGKYKVLDTYLKRETFRWNKDVDGTTDARKVSNGFPVIAAVKKYEAVNKISDFLCVGYDDIRSVEYMEEQLEPYWKRNGDTFEDVAKKAVEEYEKINQMCDKFDAELTAEAMKMGGKYADIVNLVYRQVIAGHKLVEKDGKLLFMSKECFSNGCIATVDITYPSIPMFLKYNPELVKGMLNPIFGYVDSGKWKYDFAPHDIGKYPKANGQIYACTDERVAHNAEDSDQMPIEECGNMILCVAAVCKAIENVSYAKEHEEILTKWAEYLLEYGYDPEKQLCTDDFAGHLEHNANLSVKAILAIGAWGDLLNKMGSDGTKYLKVAKDFAKKWKIDAFDNDHYKLAFDKPGTWSIKYNLVWDKFLELNLFDEDIFETETAYYKTKLNKYGLPLDSRADWTKSDWQMWSVCLTDDEEYRNEIIGRMWNMICDIRHRVPFSDYYYTSEPDMVSFQNRTVQGGLFMPILIRRSERNE